MYQNIFDEVVDILHNDYAGCLDKKGWDFPGFYRDQIKLKNDINDAEFVKIVQDYLLDFKDLHMNFKQAHANERVDVGFSVRRYNDLLYITASGIEKRVEPGEAILSLDGITVPELVEVHARELMEKEAERENWIPIILCYKQAKVKGKNGILYTLDISKFEKESTDPEHSLKVLEEDSLLLTLTDFMDHNAIAALIKENNTLLTNAEKLIIDVRVNKGGSDLAYFDLLPYLFEGESVDINSFDDGIMLTNCTGRNVELRKKLLKRAFSSIEDPTTRNQIDMLIEVLEENKGKGFVELDFAEMIESLIMKTKPGPKNVIILTDVYCGSSGDSFVEICKNSSKVTVIGRPTLGLNDYANIAVMDWENKFELWYPTSKLSKVDEGKGMSGIGIQPDIYIPWTPEHINEDIDLTKALELAGQRDGSTVPAQK
ncbi:S41 family peptidase [Virgibacillus flavescens]|uniref:S41 family peptidase n=1 Tax=Virgibacillus flavescens TaxID=1611422 RepID=UPI003D335757